jgi:response regulator RpfG family c-di-GMP phosphodiesterase
VNPILIVDDDPNVLSGLNRQLRGEFEVTLAGTAVAALVALNGNATFAVIVSDMRMPDMSGSELLRKASELSPLSVRMMLTGSNELQTAIAAVNEGKIFRFLSKPCPTETLASAIRAGIEQYRLVTAEKELLEKTLKGSVKVLTEVLALANPAAFGRAERIRRLVMGAAQERGDQDSWKLEVATMLSQIGCIAVPEIVLEKIIGNGEATTEDRAMFERHAQIGSALIAQIPRLESVSAIVAHQCDRFDGVGGPTSGPQGDRIPIGARLLKVALDLDALTSRGLGTLKAIAALKCRVGHYDPSVLKAFETVAETDVVQRRTALPVSALRMGMIVDQDIVNAKNVLMVGKGNEITEAMLARLRNLGVQCPIREPVYVLTAGDQ